MGPDTTATVFIVDDNEDIQEAILLLVRSVGLVGECYATAQEFLDRFDPERPGCLVLDLCMPGMSGLELQKILRQGSIAPPIIFLTAHGEIPLASDAIRAGAVDFIQKPFRSEALLDRIRQALRLDDDHRRQRALCAEVEDRAKLLTNRERQIMELVVRGDTTKQIASQLLLSPKTVDNHRLKILEKMRVENATQLARLVANASTSSR